jgi:hypothetical protein
LASDTKLPSCYLQVIIIFSCFDYHV